MGVWTVSTSPFPSSFTSACTTLPTTSSFAALTLLPFSLALVGKTFVVSCVWASVALPHRWTPCLSRWATTPLLCVASTALAVALSACALPH